MHRRHAFIALLFACAGLSAAASVQSSSGLYLSLEVGLNAAPSVELLGNSTDRASRCDEFINPLYADVAGCTDPNRGSGAGWKTDYDPAMGILAGGAMGILAGGAIGYRVGGRLRIEAEWFHRASGYDQTSPVASATGDTLRYLF